MKILMGQPASERFLWEMEVLLANIRSLDKEIEIVLVFDDQSPLTVRRLGEQYNAEIHQYHDERGEVNYPATNRPYLFWRYFKEDPAREAGTYFQIETDIIFREMPKLPELSGKVCLGSDCGVYMNHQYLSGCTNSHYIIDRICRTLHIDEDLIRRTPGIGAQYIYTNPTAQLWWHIWQDSDLIHQIFQSSNSNVQVWAAEMFAQLYNFAKFGWEVKIEPELEFCRPTDPIERWSEVKILHNAGVTGADSSELFYKGKYTSNSPFHENLDWVRRDKCSRAYAEAIKKAYTNIA